MITLSGTISASDLNANSDEERAQIAANLAAGDGDVMVPIEKAALSNATALRDRHFLFTPQTDMELRGLRLAVVGVAATTMVITLTLEAADPFTTYDTTNGHTELPEYLLEKTVALSVTSTSASEATGGASYVSTSGERHYLLGGVTYRLILSSDHATAAVRAYGGALLRVRRRKR